MKQNTKFFSKLHHSTLNFQAFCAFLNSFICVFILFSTNSCVVIKTYKKTLQSLSGQILYEDIAPIINKKCMNCHSANQTLINFSDYESIYGRKAMIKYTIEKGLMPPWPVSKEIGEWKNDLSLTSQEKEMFLKWLNSGLPYNNKNIKLFNYYKDLNSIKNPDYVMKSEEPVEIPAEGAGLYKKLIFDPRFKEDKWVKEIEFVLKPQVIHHIGIRIVDIKYLPEMKKLPTMKSTQLLKNLSGWIPGYPKYLNYTNKDMGIKIPKNTFLTIFIHYEPTGKKVIDSKTKVKLKFHSKTPKHSLIARAVKNKRFIIPPYHDNYLVRSRYKVRRDAVLYSITSHMHLRGKASSVLLISPEGKKEEIYRLNSYNFNFQHSFLLKKPLLIRKGSTLICKNWFDNSTGNPINPDPSKAVRWGYYLNDEMSECYFEFIVSSDQEHFYYFFRSFFLLKFFNNYT